MSRRINKVWSQVPALVALALGVLAMAGSTPAGDGPDQDSRQSDRAGARLVADALAKLPSDRSLERVGTLFQLGVLQRALNDPEGARETLRRAADEAEQIETQPIPESPVTPSVRAMYLGLAARELARAGDRDSARSAIERAKKLLEDPEAASPRELAAPLDSLAQAHAVAGDPAAAKETLARLRALIDEAKPEDRAGLFLGLIQATVHLGDFDGAFGLALAPPFDLGSFYDNRLREGQTQPLAWLAHAIRAEDGKEGTSALDRLLRVPLLTIQPGIFVAQAEHRVLLMEIAQAQARVGDIPGAIKTTDSLAEEADKVECLVAVAKSQIQANDLEAARATLQEARGRTERIADERARFRLRYPVAIQQIEAEDATGASESLRLLDDVPDHMRIRTAVLAARLRERAGDAEGARKSLEDARRIAEERRRKPLERPGAPNMPEDYGRLDLALNEVYLGNVQAALELSGAIVNASPKGQSHRFIARIQAEAGDIDKAADWIVKQPAPIQFWAWTGVMQGIAGRAGLRETLSDATRF
jgi:tetratricopeptide (TPR) repeat protein